MLSPTEDTHTDTQVFLLPGLGRRRRSRQLISRPPFSSSSSRSSSHRLLLLLLLAIQYNDDNNIVFLFFAHTSLRSVRLFSLRTLAPKHQHEKKSKKTTNNWKIPSLYHLLTSYVFYTREKFSFHARPRKTDYFFIHSDSLSLSSFHVLMFFFVFKKEKPCSPYIPLASISRKVCPQAPESSTVVSTCVLYALVFLSPLPAPAQHTPCPSPFSDLSLLFLSFLLVCFTLRVFPY